MSWLTNLVPPRLRALVKKTDIPDNLWHKCPSCEQMLFHRELLENHHVCRYCNHHMRIDAKTRLKILFDSQQYTLVRVPSPYDNDPIKFKDSKRYVERIKEARAKTNLDDAILTAHGTVGGIPVVTAVFDFNFMGGSMGMAVGNGILAAAETAIKMQAPLVLIPSSGGARMQEGMLSLMQMPRTVLAIQKVKEAKLPFINILCDPTTGGVAASFALLGDINLAEPGAIIGFTGARVLEETLRQKLPEGFQKSEFLYEHGMIDAIVHRHQLKDELIKILRLILRH